jgi:Transcriptional regulatory protein, C terminal
MAELCGYCGFRGRECLLLPCASGGSVERSGLVSPMGKTSSTSTPRAAADAAVTFGVLGPLEVREGGSLLDVPGRQERALLALLLTAPGRVFSVSAIVDGLWSDEPPAGAEKAVQVYVSRLRRALPGDGGSLVLTRSPGYLAAVDPECVDAERFRALAAAGRRDLGAGLADVAASSGGQRNASASACDGVLNFRVCRGRSLSSWAMASKSAWVSVRRSRRLGRY